MSSVKFKFSMLFGCFLILLLSSCEEDISPQEAFEQAILGDWVSQSSEFDPASQSYTLRNLKITERTWSIKVENFGDEARTFPLFTLEFEGPYEITEASEVLNNAFNGTFEYTEKVITSFVEPTTLGLGDCGLIQNERKDYSSMDCVWLESITLCPADFDLISIENDVLFSGKRTNNMCEEEGRPTERGFPMIRN